MRIRPKTRASRLLPLLAWRSALLALVLGVGALGCSTWAEMQGPRVSVGIEYDVHDGISPRVELGYQYLMYNWIAGYGGEGGVAWSIANERLELFADGRFYAGILYPMMVGRLGGVLTVGRHGFRPGIRMGFGVPMFWPPEACTVGIEGDQPSLEEKCGGQWTMEDVVHPNWLPMLELVASYLPRVSPSPFEGVGQPFSTSSGAAENEFSFALMFAASFAEYFVLGGTP